MKSFKEFIDSLPDQMDLCEMTGVVPDESGLQHHVFISPKGGAKHGPRIKVSNIRGKFSHDDNFSMSVSGNPEITAGECKLKEHHVENIKDWIRLNKKHLLKVWNDDTMGSSEHIAGIQKL